MEVREEESKFRKIPLTRMVKVVRGGPWEEPLSSQWREGTRKPTQNDASGSRGAACLVEH